GLELELMPQRGELLDQVDDSQLGFRAVPLRCQIRRELPQIQGLGLGRGQPRAKPIENSFDFIGAVHGAFARLSKPSTGSRVSRNRSCKSTARASSESLVVSVWNSCDSNRRAGSRSASYAACTAENRSGARSGGNSRTSSRYRRRISDSPASRPSPR